MVKFLGFPISQKEKKTEKSTVKASKSARPPPGHKGCATVITVCGLVFGDLCACYLLASMEAAGVGEGAIGVRVGVP